MKKNILPIIFSFLIGIIIFFVGYQIGINANSKNAINSRDSSVTKMNSEKRFNNKINKIENDLSYKQLKQALLKKEKKNILKYLEITGKIETKKEGSLFNKEYVKYFCGYIQNNLILLPIKDIQVKVNFYSNTNTLIDSKTIIIYNFVGPKGYSDFMEKIDVPNNVSSINYKILNAKSAEKEYQKDSLWLDVYKFEVENSKKTNNNGKRLEG